MNVNLFESRCPDLQSESTINKPVSRWTKTQYYCSLAIHLLAAYSSTSDSHVFFQNALYASTPNRAVRMKGAFEQMRSREASASDGVL